ncbi:MAG TPA: UDP-3-O-(3-hydroxymyristoyl)glucosamine N-acyltransferase [Burkholderiaceae bacterium]|nr:UDP-3-O-(3-hydroxymyristoyl)glucosamine N-acyltransferase [Burkholderiaceae bacterium]
MDSVTLGEIAAQLGGELIGDPALPIARLGPLEDATRDTLAFLSNPRYRKQLATSQAGCVIVAPSLRDEAVQRGAALVAPDPYLYFARLTQWWARRTQTPPAAGVHPSAVVDPQAQVDASASIGALAVIEAGAVVERGAVIGAHCIVGRDARIGAFSRLVGRVTISERCVIGERCILHPGVVIGADGFGFAPAQGHWEKIEQLGTVRIGNDVEIGANTCIDRGALGDTLIGDGAKLDNQIQIGHNVQIGAHTVMAGCTGVAGSAKIGAHCQIGGAAIILGHLELADGVIISAGTAITRSILKPGMYSGVFPFDDNASWEKNAATLRHLHELRDRLRALEKKST